MKWLDQHREHKAMRHRLDQLAACGCVNRRPNPKATALGPEWRAEICNDCGIGITTRLVWNDRLLAAYAKAADRFIGCLPCAGRHDDLRPGQGCPSCKAAL